MNRIYTYRVIFIAWMVCLFAMRSASATPLKVKITADRVNMRAAAELRSEVVGQLEEGEVVVARGITNEWVRIHPPSRVDLWVHGDFIRDYTVTADALNVRAGPSINYTTICRLAKGTRVTSRGTFGEWIKIAPPEEAAVYISRDFVRAVPPPPPPPKPVPPPEPVRPKPLPEPVPPVVPEVQQEAPPAPPPPPKVDLDLVPLKGQGEMQAYGGWLKKAFIFNRGPADYRLVEYRDNRMIIICYVKGNEEQLDKLLNEELTMEGWEFWVQGVKQPVLVPRKITRKSSP